MRQVKKAEYPLRVDDTFYYPLTTVDQVIDLETDKRLSEIIYPVIEVGERIDEVREYRDEAQARREAAESAVVGSERIANKVEQITEQNKDSEVLFPSNKAVAEYVEGHSGTVTDVLDSTGSSLVSDGVANIPDYMPKSGGTFTGDILMGKATSTKNKIIFPVGNRYWYGLSLFSTYVMLGGDNVLSRINGTQGRPKVYNARSKKYTDLAYTTDILMPKTELDTVLIPNTKYFLGTQTDLSLTLPTTAEVGQEITVSWYNGEVPATLSIDGTMLRFDYVPSANTRSEISCIWDNHYWSVLGIEQEVPVDE